MPGVAAATDCKYGSKTLLITMNMRTITGGHKLAMNSKETDCRGNRCSGGFIVALFTR
jgi:hypothetical protein